MPAAALAAIGRLAASGMLAPHLDPATADAFAGATALADIWLDAARMLFEVEFDPAAARQEIEADAANLGVDPAPALAALGNAPVRFSRGGARRRGSSAAGAEFR